MALARSCFQHSNNQNPKLPAESSRLVLVLLTIMSRVYVGNLDPRVSERDLEDEFRMYGVLRRSAFVRHESAYGYVATSTITSCQGTLLGA
ncbi:hypothetical protein NC651_039920 [Populus alba x Populus x berolinensis]|nr:hypothetical protein NC651_039920 [Populus alba x Populus x berolinensis]